MTRCTLSRIALTTLLSPLILTTLAAQSLTERIDTLLATDPVAERMQISVRVVDPESNDVLYDTNGKKLLVPASNIKLYTSAAALDLFGPDHRFRTTVGLTTTPVDGHLEGDIILKSGGDPVLTSDDLATLAKRVKNELGVSRIVGDLVLDLSLFEIPIKGPGWAWDDDPDYYNMSLGPLMLDYNVLQVAVDPSATGTPSAKLIPHATWPPIHNSSRMGNADSTNTVTITRKPFTEPILVSGTMTAGAETSRQRLTPATPHLWIRSVFAEMLRAEGITWIGNFVTATAPTDAPVVAIHHDSKPMSEIIALFNKPSENAIGEMLFHHIALEILGETGDWSKGATAMHQWLDQIAGLPDGSYSIRDGSGLSRYNMISADSTTALLDFMWEHPHRQVYMDSLTIAGVDGTARNRMKETVAEGKIHAKSGTMTGVSCWSGYAQTREGDWLLFSILTNGYIGSSAPSRALQDKISVILAEQ